MSADACRPSYKSILPGAVLSTRSKFKQPRAQNRTSIWKIAKLEQGVSNASSAQRTRRANVADPNPEAIARVGANIADDIRSCAAPAPEMWAVVLLFLHNKCAKLRLYAQGVAFHKRSGRP